MLPLRILIQKRRFGPLRYYGMDLSTARFLGKSLALREIRVFDPPVSFSI